MWIPISNHACSHRTLTRPTAIKLQGTASGRGLGVAMAAVEQQTSVLLALASALVRVILTMSTQGGSDVCLFRYGSKIPFQLLLKPTIPWSSHTSSDHIFPSVTRGRGHHRGPAVVSEPRCPGPTATAAAGRRGRGRGRVDATGKPLFEHDVDGGSNRRGPFVFRFIGGGVSSCSRISGEMKLSV